MKIVLTPDWFLGSDVLIEFFSFAVLLSFFILSYRNYKLSKNKNTLYLGIGFLLIALAELATILTKVILFYDTSFTQNIGLMAVTYHVVKSVDIFYYTGFFFHKLLTLVGFYVIYRIPLKTKLSGDVLLSVCFILIAALFSTAFYYIFHITAFLLLLLIISSYNRIYKKNKSNNTELLIIAFGLLAFSQFIFILSSVGVLYVAGQIIQLISYIILLFLIIRIIKSKKIK